MAAAMARMAALVTGDPFGARTFSGSVRHLLLALRDAGALASARDVELPATWRRIERIKYLISTGRSGAARLLGDWSERAIAARSARARAALADERGYNSVLAYGTNFVPPGHGSVTTGAALDVTFAQLAASREGWFAQLSQAEAAACIARQRRVFEQCDLLFPRTNWCAESLVADYSVPRSRIVVTGAGANFEVRPRRRESYDSRTLLFVGRDWERKQGPLALDALRIARRARPDLRLVIVGPRREPAREPGVEWMGPLDGDDRAELIKWYEAASLFLMPSRFEPYGVALVEAMAAGCPPIALDRGAAREIVEHGTHGWLLADSSAGELADAILYLLSDRDRLARMGASAAERATGTLTWQRAAAAIADAFDRPDATGRRTRGEAGVRDRSFVASA
jgi:glycosyltransferase involved in cell wall biosynthesis